jgi:hypothetical protein
MSSSKVLRTLFLLFMFSLTLFVSGCTSSYGGGSLFDAHSGTKALRATFMDNSPPDTVYENTTFNVGVILDNYGATTISNGILVIGADEFSSRMISGSDRETFSIEGRDATRTFRGEREVKFFALNAPEINPKTEQEATISMKTCYAYLTTAQESVCLDTVLDTYDSGKRACTMKEKISLGSQGAPVVIREIDVARVFSSTTKVRFMFTIRVANEGDGFVVRSSDFAKFCSNDAFSDNAQPSFGRAVVSATLGFDSLDCGKKNYVDLSQNDEDYVVCKSKDMDVKDNSYITSLKVNVNYGYVTIQSKDITIIRLIE